MKKFFLLLIFFVLQINAQVKIGVQAGINLANISMDPTPEGYDIGSRNGLILGGILNYNFSPVLGLQIAPAYIQKGASIDISTTDDGANIEIEATFSANYIDVPFLLKATFGNQQVKPFLLAGASIAFLMGDVKSNIDKATVDGQDVTNSLTSEQKE
jgi:hypothetical protein